MFLIILRENKIEENDSAVNQFQDFLFVRLSAYLVSITED